MRRIYSKLAIQQRDDEVPNCCVEDFDTVQSGVDETEEDEKPAQPQSVLHRYSTCRHRSEGLVDPVLLRKKGLICDIEAQDLNP